MRIIPALLRCTAYYLAFTEQALNPPNEALLSHKLFCQGQGGEEDFAQQNSHMRPQTYGLVPSCQNGISHCLHLSKEVYVVLSPFARKTHLSNVRVSHSIMTRRGRANIGKKPNRAVWVFAANFFYLSTVLYKTLKRQKSECLQT